MFLSLRRSLATTAVLLALSSCAPTPTAPVAVTPVVSGATIADTLISDGRFSKFVGLIQRSGLMDSLRTSGPLTMFAPTDAAFNQLPAPIIESLIPQNTQQMPSPSKLQAFVRINQLAGVFPPSGFLNRSQQVQTMAGTYLIVDGTQNGRIVVTTVTANVGGPNIAGVTTARSAQVLNPVTSATNGIIYPIDNVLVQ